MFPPTPDPSRPAVRSLRTTIRNAADLAIAFMTLEGYGLDDLRPARSERPLGHHGSTDDAAATPSSGSGSRAAVGRELPFAPTQSAGPTQPILVKQPLRVEHPLDLDQPLVAPHPHRRALRSATTARRPGVVPAREQHCLTPLARPDAIADPASPSPRRRTAPQDAPH